MRLALKHHNYKRIYANIVDLGSYVLCVMHVYLSILLYQNINRLKFLGINPCLIYTKYP